MKFGLVVQEEMLFKDMLIWGSGGPFVQWSRTIGEILVKVIMRNNSIKLFWIWNSSSGEDAL